MNDQDWIEQIPGSFGCADCVFASHQLDRQRAKEMLTSAITNEATMDQIAEAIADFLRGKKCVQAHIESQIERVRNLSFNS